MIYIYGDIEGVHTPYKYSTIKTKEDFEISRQIWEDDGEGNYTMVGLDDVTIKWELEDINYIAGQKITSVYPEYKQLNILREGTEEEKQRMQTYINTVREWANSENPDPWDGTLDSIVP